MGSPNLRWIAVGAVVLVGLVLRTAFAGEPSDATTRLVVEADGRPASGARVGVHLGYRWQPTGDQAGRAVKVESSGRVETAAQDGRIRLPPANASVPALPPRGLVGVSADGSQVGLWSAEEVNGTNVGPLRLGPATFLQLRIQLAAGGQGLPSGRPPSASIQRVDPDGPGLHVELGVAGFLHGAWLYSAAAPPGVYELTLGMVGYAPVSAQRIELVTGTTTSVDLVSPQATLAEHVGSHLPPMRRAAEGESAAADPGTAAWARGERDYTVLLFREQWRDGASGEYERMVEDIRSRARVPSSERARLRVVVIESKYPDLLRSVRDEGPAAPGEESCPEILADDEATYRRRIGIPEGRWSILLNGRGVVVGVSADWYALDAGRTLLDVERRFLDGMSQDDDEWEMPDIPWEHLGPHVSEWAGNAALGVAGVLKQVRDAK